MGTERQFYNPKRRRKKWHICAQYDRMLDFLALQILHRVSKLWADFFPKESKRFNRHRYVFSLFFFNIAFLIAIKFLIITKFLTTTFKFFFHIIPWSLCMLKLFSYGKKPYAHSALYEFFAKSTCVIQLLSFCIQIGYWKEMFCS